MTVLQHLVSSTQPALAHMLTVTAHAWGLSDQLPAQRFRVQRSDEVKAPQAHSLRWAI